MPLRQLHLVVGIILLLSMKNACSECPTIYRMIDKDHSYCATKNSLRSLAPTKKEIELILEMHNQERFHVNANDMQKMYWNYDLAEIAQHYADHCDYNHDTSSQRQAPRLPLSTGQNLAMGYKTWMLAIQGWADEKKDFVYDSRTQHGVVGHYTQMVKNTAALIGCGLAICPKSSVDPNNDWPYYVCNYVTGQLGDNKPYTLVDTSKSINEQLYDCRGLVCLYNGILDLNTCQCQCESYTSGSECENLNCSKLSDKCDYGKDKSLCKKYSNIPVECPKFCGLCDQYDEMKKYYDSIDLFTVVKIETVKNTQFAPSIGNAFQSSVFVLLIIVSSILFVIK